MGKGILLELHGRNAVVLTPQGEFRRVAVPAGAWEVGDEIDMPPLTRATPWGRWGLAAAAAVVLSVSPVGYRSWTLAQPVAVVTVDINPSLRLTLNKNEQVLKAEGLNSDGVTLLQGVEWKRQPLGDVVATLTAHAVEAGKLNLTDEAGAVVVAVASAKLEELSPSQAETIATDARKAIQAEVQHQGQARAVAPLTNVAVLQGSAKEKADAEAEGLSLGQHLMLEVIHRSRGGADVPPDQMKKLGPSKLLKNLQISPGPIFKEAEQRHGGKGRKDDQQGSDNSKPASDDQVRPVLNPGSGVGVTLPGGDDNRKPDDNSRDDNSRGDNSREDRGREDRAREDKARDDKARDDRARDDRAREDRARDDKARDDRARDDRARDDRARDDKARDDKARDDKARDDKARDDKARDDKARDDKDKDGKDKDGKGKDDEDKDGTKGDDRNKDNGKPPKLPVNPPTLPVIKDPLAGNGPKDDTWNPGSGSKSGEKDGEKDGESDDHEGGRRSREREKEGDSGKENEKGNDRGNDGKRT